MEDGEYLEPGSNMLKPEEGGLKKQIWKARHGGANYTFFDWKNNYAKEQDHFWKSVTDEERRSWRVELMQEEAAAAGRVNEEDEENWYLIFHGENVGLYKNYGDFVKKRDEDMEPGWWNAYGNSKKARWFTSLVQAQKYVQSVRDGEGKFWKWGEEEEGEFPIYHIALPPKKSLMEKCCCKRSRWI